MLGEDPPAQVADAAGDERCSRLVEDVDAVPERDRWHTAGEVLRDRVLARGEQCHPERPGATEELVQRRLLLDREADERRVEGERDEGPDRQADPLALQVHGHDRDASGEPAHDPAKLVAQCLRQSRSPVVTWSCSAFIARSCRTWSGLRRL